MSRASRVAINVFAFTFPPLAILVAGVCLLLWLVWFAWTTDIWGMEGNRR